MFLMYSLLKNIWTIKITKINDIIPLKGNFFCNKIQQNHYNNPTKCVGLVQSGPHHHLIFLIINCSRHDIVEKLLSWH